MATGRPHRRDEIVGAAARLIRERGVQGTSIADIIAESGSSAGSIYHHFANKNEIVLAVARATIVEPLQEVVAAHPDAAMSPGDLLREIVRTVIQGELESALIVQLWAGSSTEPHLRDLLREQTGGLSVQITQRLERWLAGQGCADAARRAEQLGRVTMGQAMGLLAQRTLMPGLDRDAYVAEASRLLDRACLP